MAIIKKELPLVFQYIQISSPIPFYIYGSDNEKAKRLLPSNAYVLRSAELLTSEKAPNQPIWKVYVEYDDTLLTDGRIVEINGFNVDFSKYLETFGGQLVRLGDDELTGLYTVINNPAWVGSLSTLAQENTLRYFMGNQSLSLNLDKLVTKSDWNARQEGASTHIATSENQKSLIELFELSHYYTRTAPSSGKHAYFRGMITNHGTTSTTGYVKLGGTTYQLYEIAGEFLVTNLGALRFYPLNLSFCILAGSGAPADVDLHKIEYVSGTDLRYPGLFTMEFE